MTSSADVRDGAGGSGSAVAPVRHLRVLELAMAVGELEAQSRFQCDDIAERAEQAVALAEELDRPDLARRAQLVLADLLRRRGHIAEGGRRAQEIRRWATEHDAGHLLARSSFVLAAVFQELGDLSLALEQAVHAVDLLDDDALPATRIDHLTRLADCLGLSGDVAARERYDHVLRLAQEFGDVDRQLLVLNNRAYCETVIGAFEQALVWSTELQDLAARHAVPLPVGRLDTVGRALMELGRLEDAEAAMLPGVRPEALDESRDGDAGADFLLTLAEVRRRRGHLGTAQQTLDECVRRCEEYGLTAIRVRARREQAELHAATGDFRAAYEEHRLYTDELMDLQSAESDARARALQAMYETTEARQQIRRYRELSLRDPLTDLYNRRYVDDELPRMLDRAAAGAGAVTVAILDLDHFKVINDTRSHDAGDRVLRAIAALLQDAAGTAGPGSFAARMGGEEFLLVQLGEDPARAAARLEELRRAVAAHPWTELVGDLPVTVSIGAASCTGSRTTTADMLGRADGHLYLAKRQGRDRVIGDAV